ncbi:MAG: MGMT family protein, partial [Porphyromonadaceae bacterium]|nr:MGMT family protein [Porphyromonadaceae bacterium]
PAAVRAVAQALGRNPIAIILPCHRIVSSGGGLGGFSAGLETKRRLLQLEGVLAPELL